MTTAADTSASPGLHQPQAPNSLTLTRLAAKENIRGPKNASKAKHIISPRQSRLARGLRELRRLTMMSHSRVPAKA